MSRSELRNKVKENALAYTIIALLSSGGGSAITSFSGPSNKEITTLQQHVQTVEVKMAVVETKIDLLLRNEGITLNPRVGQR